MYPTLRLLARDLRNKGSRTSSSHALPRTPANRRVPLTDNNFKSASTQPAGEGQFRLTSTQGGKSKKEPQHAPDRRANGTAHSGSIAGSGGKLTKESEERQGSAQQMNKLSKSKNLSPSGDGLHSSGKLSPPTARQPSLNQTLASKLERKRALEEEKEKARRQEAHLRRTALRLEERHLGRQVRKGTLWRMCLQLTIELKMVNDTLSNIRKIMTRTYRSPLTRDRKTTEVEKCIEQAERILEHLTVCNIVALECRTYWAALAAWAQVMFVPGVPVPRDPRKRPASLQPKWIDTPFIKGSKAAKKRARAEGRDGNPASMYPGRLAVWWRGGYLVARDRDEFPNEPTLFAQLPVGHNIRYRPYAKAGALGMMVERMKAESVLEKQRRAVHRVMLMHNHLLARMVKGELALQVFRRQRESTGQQAKQ
ncbi:hypothetical protein M406DRAFT_329103 [Cryphonectria parasitica EP155]|uniref:Uncharacterized protein n=1 Tax=Cryphonectria parasitica (strain ATCC 38755 / EP155) TaxID=660469 RepID=A0A9P5CRZ7_CRYP1|nr:uncharacterized protein M406DRAFT_329103 [Cryphonectria parasitica EP155]KAF3768062.1 hypothetical protein M406DRAFT_329103 [Cryphonectria parasitica EP155]